MKLLTSLSLVLAFALALAFELPPWVYQDMQKKAPEFVTIRVTDVKTAWKKVSKQMRKTDTTVIATAVVEKVVRSKSGLKPKQKITIKYVHTTHEEGWAGPSPVPLLEKGERVPAYLKKGKDGYEPAAGGYTFETVKGLSASFQVLRFSGLQVFDPAYQGDRRIGRIGPTPNTPDARRSLRVQLVQFVQFDQWARAANR